MIKWLWVKHENPNILIQAIVFAHFLEEQLKIYISDENLSEFTESVCSISTSIFSSKQHSFHFIAKQIGLFFKYMNGHKYF